MDQTDVEFEYFRICIADTKSQVEAGEQALKKSPFSWALKTSNKSMEKRLNDLQTECVRLGYGDYVDGVFKLKGDE